MGSRSQSRRQVLKTGASVAGLGLLGSLAGCSGLGGGNDGAATPDGEDSGGSSVASDVPAGVDVVMSLDFQAMLGDQAMRGAVNEALGQHGGDDSMLPASVSAAFERLEQRTEVDVREVRRLAIFGKSGDGADSEYVGMLAYTDWSESTVRGLLEEHAQHTDATEYEGVTVYVNDDPDGTTEKVAVFSDGTVVLGRRGATEDVIDLRAGEGDPIAGQLRSAWRATGGGYARVAVDPGNLDGQTGSSAVDSMQYAYGSVYADGDARGVRLSVETGTEQAASDLEAIIQSRISLAERRAENRRTREFLANTTVTASGTTVTVRNEVDVDEIAPVVKRFVAALVGEATVAGTELTSI